MARVKSPDVSAHPGGWVQYPVPLGKGRWARLLLPAELTPLDVERITAYINSLLDIEERHE